jgi:uncharacterized protein YbjT (DUF2867 family)
MILVTGATGTTGSELVKQLAQRGAPIRVLVQDKAKFDALGSPGVEVAVGDLTVPATVEAALRGVERAYLLTPIDQRAVDMHRSFIEAARRAGTQHIVKHSALGADANSPSTTARWHGQGERLLEESGIAYTHLRPNAFMQNVLGMAQTIGSQNAFYQPAGNARVGHVDVRDVAAVAARVLTENGHAGKTYVITGPESLTYQEVAAKLSAVLGRPISYVDVAPADFKKSLLGFGLPEWLADGLLELFAQFRDGTMDVVTTTVADVAKKEPIRFDRFAQDYASAFKPS